MRLPNMTRALGGLLVAATALLAITLSAPPAEAQAVVKVGYLKEPFNINVVKLADFVDAKKVTIDPRPRS